MSYPFNAHHRVHPEREVLKVHQDQLDLEEAKVTQDPQAHLELLDNKVHLDSKVHLVPKETRVLQEEMVLKDHQGPQDHQETQDVIFLLHNQLTLKDQHSLTLQGKQLAECLERKLLHLSLKK